MRHSSSITRGTLCPTLALSLLLLYLPACGLNQRQFNELADELAHATPETILQHLEKMDPPERDRSLYLLNTGLLKLLCGEFLGSVDDLQRAKQILNSLQAISISENLGAGTVNETLRSYTGTPGERVLLQEMLALNYLMLGRLDAARVEILQADLLMRQLAEGDANTGQLASTRFVGGLVFELEHEWDDALISYRKSAEIMTRRGLPLPDSLSQSLLSLTARMGLDAEHERYRARFGNTPASPARGEGELIVLYWQGQVSSLRQHFTTVYVPELKQNISLALPYYPPRHRYPQRLSVSAGGRQQWTRAVEDIERLAREELKARQAPILAASITRMVAKQQAVQAAQNENYYAGALANLATMLSEIADVRSWNMLPAAIQLARLPLPRGEHQLKLGHRATTIRIEPGRTTILLTADTSEHDFSQSY